MKWSEHPNWSTLVGYIQRAQPDALAELKGQHVGSGELLLGTAGFGGEPPVGGTEAAAGPVTPPSPMDREAGLALVKASATKLRLDIDSLAASMKSSMALVRKIRLGSAVVTAVTGAISTLLALIATENSWTDQRLAAAVAVVTTIGALLALFAEHFERTPIGVKFAGVEELNALLDDRAIVERISMRVEMDKVQRMSDDDVLKAANELNEVAIKVLRLSYLRPDKAATVTA